MNSAIPDKDDVLNGELVYEGDRVFIYRLADCLYFRKANLLERGQCNGVYIVGGGAVAAVDIPTMEAAVEMENEIRMLFGLPLRYIFLTHPHKDHIDGIGHFLGSSVTFIVSSLLASELSRSYRGKNKALFMGIDRDALLYLGDTEIRVFTSGYTMHSPYDLFVHLPKEKALCTGDCVVEPWILYYHSADVKNWIAGLRQIGRQSYRLVLPGHGPVFGPDVIGKTADFLQSLYDLAGRSIDELAPGERCDLDASTIDRITDRIFCRPEAALIKQNGGAEAERQFRMVFRRRLYEFLK